jgi:hypothetical protein
MNIKTLVNIMMIRTFDHDCIVSQIFSSLTKGRSYYSNREVSLWNYDISEDLLQSIDNEETAYFISVFLKRFQRLVRTLNHTLRTENH